MTRLLAVAALAVFAGVAVSADAARMTDPFQWDHRDISLDEFQDTRPWFAGIDRFHQDVLPRETVCGAFSAVGLGNQTTWDDLPTLPQAGTGKTCFVVQSNGSGMRLYCLDVSGKALSPELYVLSPGHDHWEPLARFPGEIVPVGAVRVGPHHILAAGISPHGEIEEWLYHTVTDTWVQAEVPAFEGVLQSGLGSAEEGRGIVLATRIDDHIRLYTGRPKPSPALRRSDILVLCLYFAAILGIGFWFARKENSTDAYFRGGKSVPYWAAGLSIVATKLSAISFMAIPAKCFATNWLYLLQPAGNLVIAYVVIRYFLPFFCRLDVTSVYEYLEKRFDVTVRTVGSLSYAFYELVRMGVLLLLPSIVLSVVTGINIYVCIILIGVLSTVYTLLGGVEAVIWTDVVQVLIMIGGTLLAIVLIVAAIPGGGGALIDTLATHGKLKSFDWSWDLTAPTMWVIMLSWVGKIQEFISNQTIVQRFISTTDEKAAGRSMWINGIIGVPAVWLFFVLGAALYGFYHAFPQRLVPTMAQPDALVPWFIVAELPPGIAGALIGAVFAAAMSSLDSAINSMSAVLVTDIYTRFWSRQTSEKALRLAHWLTAVLGLAGTASALLMAGYNIKSLFDQVMMIIGLLGGPLAGMFALGILTTRANKWGVLAGFAVSALGQYVVKSHLHIHFFLFGLVGVCSCFIIGYLASYLFPEPEREFSGLTIHTTDLRG